MMSMKIEKIVYDSPDRETVENAVKVLSRGGIVVGPTETRYGMLARADMKRPVNAVFQLKGRPLKAATAVFVPSIADIAAYAVLTEDARRVAERFLPGPLTLVLKAVEGKLEEPVVVDGKIGLRISSAPFIQRIMEQVDYPLTATSANPSGEEECESVEEVARFFGSKVEVYVDCGVLSREASTVLDLSTDHPSIIRRGAINEEALADVLRKQLT